MDPLFANMFDNAGKVVLGVLAVAGGFLIGNVLTLIACRVLAKFLFKSKLNVTLEKALRMIGGIALAILVAFLVFRGGSGWGFGGGGSGEGSGDDGKGEGKSGEEKTKDKKDPTKPTEGKAIEVTELRVEIMTAREYPQTFRFVGERDALDITAAKTRLKKLQDDSNGKLRLLDLLIYKDSTAESNPVVLEFEEYAHALGLNTARKKPDRKLGE